MGGVASVKWERGSRGHFLYSVLLLLHSVVKYTVWSTCQLLYSQMVKPHYTISNIPHLQWLWYNTFSLKLSLTPSPLSPSLLPPSLLSPSLPPPSLPPPPPPLSLSLAVNDKHQFKKGDLLYRFRYDDGTYRTKYDSSELSARVSPSSNSSCKMPHLSLSLPPSSSSSSPSSSCRVCGCIVVSMDSSIPS